jgi:hypothetical protein
LAVVAEALVNFEAVFVETGWVRFDPKFCQPLVPFENSFYKALSPEWQTHNECFSQS